MKQDKRSKRTKLWLYEALIELMESKDYADISITELTEKSDIARQSFYRIYSSKDDILLSKMDEIHEDIFRKSEMSLECNNQFLDMVIRQLVLAFQENEKFFTAILNAGLQHKALTQFAEYIGRFYLKKEDYQELDKIQQYRIHYIVGGIYMVLFKWHECNMNTPSETIIDIMQKSTKHIDLILEEYTKNTI